MIVIKDLRCKEQLLRVLFVMFLSFLILCIPAEAAERGANENVLLTSTTLFIDNEQQVTSGYITNLRFYQGSVETDNTQVEYVFNQNTTENVLSLISRDSKNNVRVRVNVSDSSGNLWMRRAIDGSGFNGIKNSWDQQIKSEETLYLLTYWLNTAWPKDGEEHVFSIQVGTKYDSNEDGSITFIDEFETFETYNFTISSIPGLDTISLKDAENNELELTPAFENGGKNREFSVSVAGKTIKLSVSFTEGATLTIGEKSYTNALTDEEISLDGFIGKGNMATIPLKLVDAYGKENTYTLNIKVIVPFAERKPVVEAANDKKTGKIKLTIEPVDDAVSYKVFVADKADGEYTLAKEITETTYTYSGKAGTKYFFKVQAVNEAGETSAESDAINKVQLPTQVTSLKATSKKGQVTLKWKKVNGAKQYFIYMSKNGKTGWKKVGTTTKNTFVYKKGKTGQKLYFKVQALTANNKKGEFSKVVSIKVKK